MSGEVSYQGRDLEAMSFARNYHRWILEIFAPYLGSRLVEVGAGSGSFSEFLLERSFNSLSLIEPSAEMFGLLTKRLENLLTDARVKPFNALFREVADSLRTEQQPDSIIYVNVMEHIADDERELTAIHQTLAPGGRVFIFVPALRWLYGSFDKLIQHHRRYTKSELESKCEAAGFHILKSHYLDAAGVLPWWVRYRLLKSPAMEAGAVELYDRMFVPFIRVMENTFRPPLGKNLILIAEKFSTSEPANTQAYLSA
jgi:SAM-dependent methyltransferase